MTPIGPSELPQDDRPDLVEEAILKAQGLMHRADALLYAADVEHVLRQTLDEYRIALLAQVPNIVGQSAEQIRELLMPIAREHARRLEARLIPLGIDITDTDGQ